MNELYNTLLFDLDGTLIDPWMGITRSMQYALQKLGQPVPEEKDLLWSIGPPIRENLVNLLGTEDEKIIEQGVVFFRERFSTVGLFENVLYEGVPAVLETLKKAGFRILLATSKPQPYAYRILEHHQLLSYFDVVYGSQLDGEHSDKKQLIRHILSLEGFAPAKAVMIGDRLYDVAAAKVNGLFALGVSYGYGSLEELETAGADRVVHSPQEIITFLKG